MLSLIPLKDWLYLVAILACAGLVAMAVYHERQIGYAQGMDRVQGRWDKAIEADRAAKQAEEKRVATQDVKVDHATLQSTAANAAGAVRAHDAGERLQQRFAALGACPVPGTPAPAATSAPASAPGDLRANVLRRVREAAGQLAGVADARRTAGLDAEGHYDALTPVTAASTP